MDEISQETNNAIKAEIKRDKHGLYLKGNPPGPGRSKGKTLKEWQAERFRMMSDEEKQKWLEDHKVSGEIRWKMAEGNPHMAVGLKADITIADVIKQIKNEQSSNEGTSGQRVEDEQPLQDSGQKEEFDKIPSQQGAGTLQPTQVVEKYNPEE